MEKFLNGLIKCLFLILFTAILPHASARELTDVSLEVTSQKKGAEAKQDAFDEAVEKATKDLSAEMLGADKVAKSWDQMKGKILKNSTKYVVFIKGSAPTEVKGETHIQVQMRLSPDHLESVLREAGLLGTETVRVLPLIQFSEAQGSRYLWWADFSDGKQTNQAQAYSKRFFQQLAGPFKGKNISILDPTSQSFRNGLPASYRTENLRREDQILLGQYLKADLVLSGRVDVVRLRSDGADHKVDYALELWQTKTGRSLWDMAKAENVASDNSKAIQAAMEQVQPEIFKDLSVKLNDAVAAGNLNLAVVRITVEGPLNPKQQSEFKKQLGAVREIRLLRERLIEPSRITFESESAVDGSELGKILREKARFTHFAVDVSSIQDDRLVLVVKASASAQ